MTWWMWLTLSLILLLAFVLGVVYLVVHGIRAMRTISKVAEAVGAPLSEISENDGEPRPVEPPSFTQPLKVSMGRYTDAHAEVLNRAQARHNRHAEQWDRWKHFND